MPGWVVAPICRYGVSLHQPRDVREQRFTQAIHQIVARGGRCLIPVFALGRSQELLLILEEYWRAHPELHSVPIYYASKVAKKSMRVYQTYINMMNHHIRDAHTGGHNPWNFQFIKVGTIYCPCLPHRARFSSPTLPRVAASIHPVHGFFALAPAPAISFHPGLFHLSSVNHRSPPCSCEEP